MSDAEFAVYSSGSFAQHGYIARARGPGQKWIDNAHPRFAISSASVFPPFVGQEVNRMGAVTGWAAGTVIRECMDLYNWDNRSGLTLRCQTEAGGFTMNGDSGGPVFTWDGFSSSVELIGITVGASATTFTFSQWRYVEFEVGGDVGGLDVTDGGEGGGGLN